MISEERKQELKESVRYFLDRYIDKKGIFDEIIRNEAAYEEEWEFLSNCTYYTVVEEVK